MKQLRNIFTGLFFALGLLVSLPALAQEEITPGEQKENTVDVKSIVFGHIGDSYEWHITTWGNTHITIPLPVIVYSSNSGWHTFFPHGLKRTEERMRAFPLLLPEASMKGRSWNTMRPVNRFVRGTFQLQRSLCRC